MIVLMVVLIVDGVGGVSLPPAESKILQIGGGFDVETGKGFLIRITSIYGTIQKVEPVNIPNAVDINDRSNNIALELKGEGYDATANLIGKRIDAGSYQKTKTVIETKYKTQIDGVVEGTGKNFLKSAEIVSYFYGGSVERWRKVLKTKKGTAMPNAVKEFLKFKKSK